MSEKEIPQHFLDIISKITNKRARVVIDHIMEHGQITTEQLEQDYGYNHPPRAARDVREAGIPLKTVRVKSRDGKRTIAAYQFGDFTNVRKDRISGRINWPKDFKSKLIEKYGKKCNISGAELPARALQIDHRIPYEITGDSGGENLDVDDFMLLSGSLNRAKSWSCEHCKNWQKIKDITKCQTCYWAYPENYTHVGLEEIRRLDITWQKDEVIYYDQLKKKSDLVNEPIVDYVKKILKENTE